jgi:hypothetical protein
MRTQNSTLILKLRDKAIDATNLALDFIFRASTDQVLNNHRQIAPPENPGEALRASANRLLAIGLNETGQVDYDKLAGSTEYAHYQSLAASLKGFDPASLNDREEQLAFWINLYNALILDAVIQFQVKGSISRSLWIFRRAAYNIGGLRYTADDIEHGILRGNRRNPMLPLPPFRSTDPRLKHNLQVLEPRIHFALVCAARSCPPIGVYRAEILDQQLELAPANFISGGSVQYHAQSNTLCLSQIFRWYQVDFGGRAAMLETITRYIQNADTLKALHTSEPRIKFMTYDWKLNGTPAFSPA